MILCCSLLMSVALTRAHAQQDPQVRVEMSADRNQLSVNENVTVRIYVQTHGSGQPDIEVPEFEGFQVIQRAVQRPMQFSFGFGNSQPVVTSTTQYTFVLAPMGPGTFKIPPVKVTLGQRVFDSKSLALTVTGQAPQAGQNPQNQAQPDDTAANSGQPRQVPLSGGSVPVTGFHSTMDSPDSVRRVAPPTSTMTTISATIASSHHRTARPACACCVESPVIDAALE